MTFVDLFLDAVARHPDRLAVKDKKSAVSYRDLAQWAAGMAVQLRSAGLDPGDRVALLLNPSVHYVAAYLAILEAGCVAVPMNTDNTRRNISYILDHCGLGGLIGLPRLMGLYGLAEKEELAGVDGPCLFALRERAFTEILRAEDAHGLPDPYGHPSPDDLACILYTSGTTGRPKGVMLSHRNIAANTRSIVEYLGLTHQDSVLSILPFYYSYGSSLLHTHLSVGGTLFIEDQFVYPNKALERMAAEEVTGFAGVPSTFALLLHRSNFLNMQWPHLRYITQAGGPMPAVHARRLKEALPGTDIYIMYGQTEATARLSYLDPAMLIEKAGSVGKAIPGVELRVVNERGSEVRPGETGEIIARGENVMQGYWKDPEETARVLRDGWLHTGDLATVDADGFIFIAGRKGEMIKSGAHRISPKEIEEVLASLPWVVEAAVTGLPDEILGERIAAFIVPRGDETPDVRQVLMHCKQNLPSFKIPHDINFVRELPKTGTGKVRKFLLGRQESACCAG